MIAQSCAVLRRFFGALPLEQTNLMRLILDPSSSLGLRDVAIRVAHWIATALLASFLTAVLFGLQFVDLR
jgi:hypothetical protein